jgi:hypothetical protein
VQQRKRIPVGLVIGLIALAVVIVVGGIFAAVTLLGGNQAEVVIMDETDDTGDVGGNGGIGGIEDTWEIEDTGETWGTEDTGGFEDTGGTGGSGDTGGQLPAGEPSSTNTVNGLKIATYDDGTVSIEDGALIIAPNGQAYFEGERRDNEASISIPDGGSSIAINGGMIKSINGEFYISANGTLVYISANGDISYHNAN